MSGRGTTWEKDPALLVKGATVTVKSGGPGLGIAGESTWKVKIIKGWDHGQTAPSQAGHIVVKLPVDGKKWILPSDIINLDVPAAVAAAAASAASDSGVSGSPAAAASSPQILAAAASSPETPAAECETIMQLLGFTAMITDCYGYWIVRSGSDGARGGSDQDQAPRQGGCGVMALALVTM
jgi:hypothetical protein